MRTTLTIDPEVEDRLKQELALGKRSFKEIVNDALRKGLGLAQETPRQPFTVEPFYSDYAEGVDRGKLNQLVDEMEVEEFLKKASRS